MKRMLFLGALVIGVTVCSQSFGFEILDRMLGNKGSTSCCEPDCSAGNGGCTDACEPACGAGNGNGCCEPACDAGNGKGCCEPACDAGNGCCEPTCGAKACGKKHCKKHDLFGGLKGLFGHCKSKLSKKSCCEPACDAGNGCCEPACDAGNGKGCCEPACDAGNGNGCCEPACDAGNGNGCCEPTCGAKTCCKQKRCKKHCIMDLLRACHQAKKDCKARRSCSSCCEPDCGAGNGCCEPACGAEAAPVEAPAAPTPDASASTKAPGRVIAVSRTVAAK